MLILKGALRYLLKHHYRQQYLLSGDKVSPKKQLGSNKFRNIMRNRVSRNTCKRYNRGEDSCLRFQKY